MSVKKGALGLVADLLREGRWVSPHAGWVRKESPNISGSLQNMLHEAKVEGLVPLEVSLSDLKEEMSAFVKKLAAARSYIRVPGEALPGIAETGQLKNQYQTKTTRGGKVPNLRREVENVLFGYDPKAPAAQRPKYGYLSADPVGLGDYHFYPRAIAKDEIGIALSDRLSDYGGTALQLKPETRSRTTFFGGDTLDDIKGFFFRNRYEELLDEALKKRNIPRWKVRDLPSYTKKDIDREIQGGTVHGPFVGIPSPLEDPSYESLVLPRGADYYFSSLFGSSRLPSSYLETQVHGPLTLDDIETVHALSPPDEVKSSLDVLSKKLPVNMVEDPYKTDEARFLLGNRLEDFIRETSDLLGIERIGSESWKDLPVMELSRRPTHHKYRKGGIV